MRTTISSSRTFAHKFILPIFWNGLGVFVVLMLLAGYGGATWAFLFVWGIGAVFQLWIYLPLKKVQIDGDYVIISNYVKSVRIHASDIHRITEHSLLSDHPIWLHLKKPTEFGDRITFIPHYRWAPFRHHPIAIELWELMQKVQEDAGQEGAQFPAEGVASEEPMGQDQYL